MATSITFSQIEKIIQEKLFYNILFEEYYRKPEIIRTGFRMTPYEFIINMVVIRPFPTDSIIELSKKIGEKYNIFVKKTSELKHLGGVWITLLHIPTVINFT